MLVQMVLCVVLKQFIMPRCISKPKSDNNLSLLHLVCLLTAWRDENPVYPGCNGKDVRLMGRKRE